MKYSENNRLPTIYKFFPVLIIINIFIFLLKGETSNNGFFLMLSTKYNDYICNLWKIVTFLLSIFQWLFLYFLKGLFVRALKIASTSLFESWNILKTILADKIFFPILTIINIFIFLLKDKILNFCLRNITIIFVIYGTFDLKFSGHIFN